MQQNGTLTDYSPASHETGSSWSILSSIELSIKRKIESVGKPLKDWDIKIYRGILTGCNEAFIIDGAKREEILNKCRSAAERERTDALIRPILRGRDIKRYKAEWAGLYVLNVHNGIKEKNIPPIKIEEYPAIKAHLDLYWDKIAKRSDKGDTPYNLRNCVYMEDFLKQPKIGWGNLNLEGNYAYIDKGINAPSPFIVPGDYYLLGVLNSKLADFYIKRLGVTRNGGYFEYKPMFVSQFPVPINKNNEIIDAVRCILSGKKSADIDELVCKHYGLNDNETMFIKNL